MSKSQESLEQASKAVGAACRALVRQVQSMIKDRDQDDDRVDYAKLGAHEFKVREMEQQVCVMIHCGRGVMLMYTFRSRSCSWRITWRRRGKGWVR